MLWRGPYALTAAPPAYRGEADSVSTCTMGLPFRRSTSWSARSTRRRRGGASSSRVARSAVRPASERRRRESLRPRAHRAPSDSRSFAGPCSPLGRLGTLAAKRAVEIIVGDLGENNKGTGIFDHPCGGAPPRRASEGSMPSCAPHASVACSTVSAPVTAAGDQAPPDAWYGFQLALRTGYMGYPSSSISGGSCRGTSFLASSRRTPG
jgi:hypothetical protein